MNYPGRRLSRPSVLVSTPQPEPEVVHQPEQDVQMDNDSSDKLDIISEEELQAEALMFSVLMDFGANAGLEDVYIPFEDAFEYVFQSTNKFEHVFSAQTKQQFGSEPYE